MSCVRFFHGSILCKRIHLIRLYRSQWLPFQRLDAQRSLGFVGKSAHCFLSSAELTLLQGQWKGPSHSQTTRLDLCSSQCVLVCCHRLVCVLYLQQWGFISSLFALISCRLTCRRTGSIMFQRDLRQWTKDKKWALPVFLDVTYFHWARTTAEAGDSIVPVCTLSSFLHPIRNPI